MKTLRIKDSNGRPVHGWMFGTWTGYNVGNGLAPARKVRGWQIVEPSGYARFCEGSWQQFVPFANRVLENHGYKGDIS